MALGTILASLFRVIVSLVLGLLGALGIVSSSTTPSYPDMSGTPAIEMPTFEPFPTTVPPIMATETPYPSMMETPTPAMPMSPMLDTPTPAAGN